MLDFNTTPISSLRSVKYPWLNHDHWLPLEEPLNDFSCDVLIVGAGITGAFLAEHLSSQSLKVVIIDRDKPGLGSTAASTAMLQWEIDAPLYELAELYGFEKAATIYRASYGAVQGLYQLVQNLNIPCSIQKRTTLYLAASESGPHELMQELSLRQRAGLPGQYLSHQELSKVFGIDREGAIVSPHSADADPVCLAQGLIHVARQRGVKIFKADAQTFDPTEKGVKIQLSNGTCIQANAVVLATGYALPEVLRNDLHQVSSSWAISTKPQPQGSLWRGGALIWEASEHYLYARTTVDGRIIIGGEDESIDDPTQRNDFIACKSRILQEKLAALWPHANLEIDHAWAGAFGETLDGLPLIGCIPHMPRMYAAYGYGGNGITFSFMASRMIVSLIQGHSKQWFDAFAVNRKI